MNSPARLIAGAMSGTSADGVDVAITRIEGRGLDMSAKLVLHHHRAYRPEIRKAIFEMRGSGKMTLRDFAHVTRKISLAYAEVVNEALSKANLRADELSAIAAHGQTLFHDVPLTIQTFDPSLLASEVGCPVVSDFRRADLAAGGQGAPLVPFADYILFRDPKKSRVLLNIGGIGNITFLKAGGEPKDVIAYDTGPGNCIIDDLCRKLDPAGPGYDADGFRSSRGKVIQSLLDKAAGDSYFRQQPPKSTDGPSMLAIFGDAYEITDDLIATAAALTARTIAGQINRFGPDEVIASGGGTKNPAIMSMLAAQTSVKILTTDDFAVPSDAKEALAFALLAAATLDGIPSNVPSATGAKRPVVLGSITPRP